MKRIFVSLVLSLLPAMMASAQTPGQKQHLKSPSRKQRGSRQVDTVSIVPSKSIGRVSLGQYVKELPVEAQMSASHGEIDHVQFSIVDGRVDDVWLDDLRTFPYPVEFEGQRLDPRATWNDIKAIFGECRKIDGIKGGVFFNCSTGVTIACDWEEKGITVQVRLKRR